MSRTTSSSTCFSLKIRTALIGSPTYLSSPNLRVLTRPRLRTSRHGMMRARSMDRSELREVLEEPDAVLVALLRVKLDPEYIAAIHRAGERRAVFRGGDRRLGILALEIV